MCRYRLGRAGRQTSHCLRLKDPSSVDVDNDHTIEPPEGCDVQKGL